MSIRRISVILPCPSWDDFPTHLGNQASAELLAAWTSLWHPALLATTGRLPGWHQAEEPPDPASLEGELVLVPPPSRQRMPSDWCDRLRMTSPQNPAPIETTASRADTVAAVLRAAELDTAIYDPGVVRDFLALGFAYLLIELLTRAMRYSSVLDSERFESAVVGAASAATSGNNEVAQQELARAFDLLADARNHVYSVDFYLIDLTLVADSLLGEPLRAKLCGEHTTNLLISGEQIERVAESHPETLNELRRALDAGIASIVGGRYSFESVDHLGPEALLADLQRGQLVAKQRLDREYAIYGQFNSNYAVLLPEVLRNLGFHGALHASFDGGQLPRADQRKTKWGVTNAASVEALSITPLDAAQAESWLKLAQRIGDTIAHDHVATVLLASWPGSETEYAKDLRRSTKYGSVLGRIVTLEEYFRVTREVDDWVKFAPREYPNRSQLGTGPNAISKQVDKYREEVQGTHRRISAGLAAIAGLKPCETGTAAESEVVINGWSFGTSYFVGLDPSGTGDVAVGPQDRSAAIIPDVLGSGYRAVLPAATLTPVALAKDLVLRNERMELSVSKKTGGIQSLRLHRDRNTRVSQRLVFHHKRGGETIESQMTASRVEITRNDALVGEITSHGRLTDAKGRPLASFTQRVRVIRGVQPIVVHVEIEPQQLPDGDVWKSYFASRLAWLDDALDIRRGSEWGARPTTRDQIESPEWIEIDDAIGRITCFGMGLPYHRRAAPNWMDTLLITAGEDRRQFQFAIGLEPTYPSQTAMGLLTSGAPYLAELPNAQQLPRGWFLHVAAKNVIATHIEPLAESASGVRLRLLETEGKDTRSALAAFSPIQAARITDFRGNMLEVLSVDEGAAKFDLGPHRWIQIEAEWGMVEGVETRIEG
jgi:alpha-mannosidase